ncbi:MAG TPA: hypothetical protein DEA52_05440 [Clostridiaceae bacterium]|nr:hypothetical protein [Clostridiaceae bacterium]
MLKGKKILLGVSALVLVLFVGVFVTSFFVRNTAHDKTESSGGMSPMPPESPGFDGDYEESPSERPGGQGDQIIGTYSLNFETLSFQETVEAMEALVREHKGYIEYSEVYNQPSSEGRIYKSARYTVRIPKEEVYVFNSHLKDQAHVVSENSNLVNVTRYYNDTAARLESLEAQRKRLLELYDEANRMEDIIQIESRLQDILYQIESLKGEIRYLDEAVSYSTVSIYLQEVTKLSTGETIHDGFFQRLSNALKDSMYVFQEAMITFLVVVVYLIPFLVIFGGLSAVAVKVRRKHHPKKSKDASGTSTEG